MTGPGEPRDVTAPAGARTDVRWWQLYREEKRRLYPKGREWRRRRFTRAEITRCAREATKRFQAEAGDRRV